MSGFGSGAASGGPDGGVASPASAAAALALLSALRMVETGETVDPLVVMRREMETLRLKHERMLAKAVAKRVQAAADEKEVGLYVRAVERPWGVPFATASL